MYSFTGKGIAKVVDLDAPRIGIIHDHDDKREDEQLCNSNLANDCDRECSMFSLVLDVGQQS